MSVIEWGAALAMGLMGSSHCVAMCGPLSNVLGSRTGDARTRAAREEPAPARRRLPLSDQRPLDWSLRAATQAGRLTTYASLGALAGVAGTGVQHIPSLAAAQLGVRIAAASLLVGTGLYVAGLFTRFAWIERALSPIHHAVGRVFGRPRTNSVWGRYLAGLTWGLLPCGLVLGALGLAVIAGSALAGAGVMLAFGLGTLPALFAVDLFAATFQRLVRDVWLRRAGGALIALSGFVQVGLAIEQARSQGTADERPCCAAHHHAASR